MRTIAYVDGFNFYYGSVKSEPRLKWVDFFALCRLLVGRRHDVTAVKYFTAVVDNRPGDPHQNQRQEVYLRALRATGVEVHLGNFQTLTRRFPATLDGRSVEVWRTEEKGSDVNLASHLVRDAFTGSMDCALLVTNDSDQRTPVEMVVERGVEVITVNPHRHAQQKRQLTGTGSRRLQKRHLGKCSFRSS